MSLIYWSGLIPASEEGEMYSTVPFFLSILYMPDVYPPAQIMPGNTSQRLRKILLSSPFKCSELLRKEVH